MKTKIKLIITIILLSKSTAFSQWQWAKQTGGNGIEYSGGALIDANNNIYIGGNYEISCFFDNDTLNANGYNDMLLAKYDATGNELWSQTFGGDANFNYHEYGGVALIDNSNSCLYYVGHFAGTLLIIGSDTINPAITGHNMFLAKFDLSGNPLWTVGFGSGGNDYPGALTLDGSGNIYFTGIFGNNGTIGSYSVNKGCFLTKLDSGGNILAARNEITGGYITSMKILNGNLIFCAIGDNDTTIIDTASLITANQAGVILATIDLNGNYISGKRFASKVISYPNRLEVDASNNIYLIGYATDSINFDGTIISNNGLWDMFFCKFDNNYNTIWAQQTHSTGTYGGFGASIIPDSDGNYYITGSFSGNATFDTFNVNSLSATSQDMFIARYDPSGTCIGIRHFGEARSESVNMDSNGDLIVAGEFINSATIGSTTLTSHGSTDIFIAKSDGITGIGGEGRVVNNQLIIYANPTTGKCNVTIPDEFLHEKNLSLNIFDNSGKLIQQIPVQMNEGKIKLNLEAEAKGVYNVILSNGTKSYNGKIVFE